MKIVLLRHGRPVLPSPASVTPAELPAWVAAYNTAELDLNLAPPPAAIDLARECQTVVCSTLRRSTVSALQLGRTPDVTDAVFDELRLTYASWRGPRLPAPFWLVFFRLLALAGYGGSSDSDRARAGQAARKLIDLAIAGGPVLFIGHGMLNQLVARRLRAEGWHGPARPSTRHWGCSTYMGPR